jgi:carbonic anhydrase/acetyltransferase-like protein (isoleucine patch superfamily)
MPCYALDGTAPALPPEGRYWIAPSASIIGRVTLSVDVGVWFGAVLRGDNDTISIGEGSNIQDNSMLHTDFGLPLSVGSYCTVGHHVILHGCTIGNQSLIGMGAVVLNGARIGNNCLIGAKALVTEGKDIPDGSLVIGSPARVVRPLTEKEIAEVKQSALVYVRNWQRYAKGFAEMGGAGVGWDNAGS